MGLDQYLIQEQTFSRYENLRDSYETYREEYEKADAILDAVGYPKHDDINGVEVRVTVLQWRKANQIHKWFVDNVQDGNDDCGYYYVSEERLRELQALCQRVLDSIELVPARVQNGTLYNDDHPDGLAMMEEGFVVADSTVAEELLPTGSGFFFGSTDYDKWYVQDLEYTRDGIERVLDNLPSGAYLHYSSSW